jgi:hypothetical protein
MMVQSLDNVVESVERAFEIGGSTISSTGLFIAARLEIEGPTYPNQLWRDIESNLTPVNPVLVPRDDTATRQYIWNLKELEVIEDVTQELLDSGDIPRSSLWDNPDKFDEDLSALSDQELVELQFTRNYYDLTSSVDMSWLDEPISNISNSLLSRGSDSDLEHLGSFSRETADIPESILNPRGVLKRQQADSARTEDIADKFNL